MTKWIQKWPEEINIRAQRASKMTPEKEEKPVWVKALSMPVVTLHHFNGRQQVQLAPYSKVCKIVFKVDDGYTCRWKHSLVHLHTEHIAQGFTHSTSLLMLILPSYLETKSMRLPVQLLGHRINLLKYFHPMNRNKSQTKTFSSFN